MGTRAIITKEGRPLIATHWDGYPESLGEDLKKMLDLKDESIIKVAEQHQIDFIDKTIGKIIMEQRLNELMKKHGLTKEQIKQGYRSSNLISSDDYEITDIKYYDDFAEYQYDIRDNSIFWKELSGSWLEHEDDSEWELLKTFSEVK